MEGCLESKQRITKMDGMSELEGILHIVGGASRVGETCRSRTKSIGTVPKFERVVDKDIDGYGGAYLYKS